ncbi:GNAT family N-acetyltransferase [Alkaliphilus serpentinus]|uniref:GNAT family N-acetyltransferase n=1 Tax=Alkaliphilus serpentinus TaxID=1482731 RepID=A0A833HL63_9FIRM|nr:GNAT family N-acetyltransferase [Alkaliphilus serpentinus]KAB3524962.1 GNAT family N-acetyltransferase [Alkaliphilus serpentinus]
MLEFTIAEAKDQQQIMKIAKEYYLPLQDDQHQTYKKGYTIVKEGGSVLGFSSYRELIEDASEINCIYIIPRERGNQLGEGLLRATLYHLQEKGYKDVFIKPNNQYNGFIEGLGIYKLQNHPEFQTKILKLDLWEHFHCQPIEFFNRGCKGKKK